MSNKLLKFSLVLVLCGLLLTVPTAESRRKDKQLLGLSLFNILTFGNEQCTSTATVTSAAGTESMRTGTCFTAEECTSNGGTAMGGCAMGFGVCCLFFVSATGGEITQNCTYIQNPGFPSALTTMGNMLSYTVRKCDPWVCSIRLDFLAFDTLGPPDNQETNGGVCQDTLTFTTPGVTATNPVICGMNAGQHVYLNVGPGATDTAVLNFAIANLADTSRMWDIKVSQLLCQDEENPPTGCFQYFMETSGQIQTFNYQDATTGHLANQDYTICVRPADGFCCVQYFPCDDADSFTLNLGKATTNSIDSSCALDYIAISGGSATCDSPLNTNTATKFCGSVLNPSRGTPRGNVPTCDCSRPFTIDVFTDGAADNLGPPPTSRGVCLNYMQIPCRA